MNWINELCTIFPNTQVSNNPSDLEQHSKDESSHPASLPDIIFYPESNNDVQKCVNFAKVHQIPITPFGAGSGLDGQAIPIRKGIVMSFERMNKILSFNAEDLTVTVQPGITRIELNKFLNKHGLFFPIDPGANASIGGMAATNASGTTAVKYGSMRDQILDLEIVLSNGDLIHTGSRAKKSSSGYNLTGLFVGSEGTLGIITSITLKIFGIPEYTIAIKSTFPSVVAAAEVSHAILTYGLFPTRVELIDGESIKQINNYGDYSFIESPTLFIEITGSTQEGVNQEVQLVKDIADEFGMIHWESSDSLSERNKIWKARHELSYAYRHQPNIHTLSTDVCVPLSKLPVIVGLTREWLSEEDLVGGVFGHVGDGNFHTLITYDKDNESKKYAAENLYDRIVKKALEFEGTCTGEHGVGLGKMKYQSLEHGAALEGMKAIKNVYDPQNILNPGKIFI
ncbi:FAD-binding protein [Chryseomicrobium palamuruense]